jgi:AraC-like DNA-binding protein
VCILAYYIPGRATSSELATLMRAGAHQLVLHDLDDERTVLQAAFRSAEQTTVAEVILEELGDELPPSVRPLVELYLQGVDGPVSIQQAARQLGVHRRTLHHRMEVAGFPVPTELRAWCRLFLAARLLEDPGRTVESVALQLDFHSSSALRNLLKRRTGLAPHALRAAGGLQYLLAEFRQSCDARKRALASVVVSPAAHAARQAPAPRARVAESPTEPETEGDRRDVISLAERRARARVTRTSRTSHAAAAPRTGALVVGPAVPSAGILAHIARNVRVASAVTLAAHERVRRPLASAHHALLLAHAAA